MCWVLQLFCKVGFVMRVFCALQMCCNVRWTIRDSALNVLLLEGERNFIFGLRTTGIYKKRDVKAGVYSIGVSRKCFLIQVNAVKTPLRHKKAAQ